MPLRVFPGADIECTELLEGRLCNVQFLAGDAFRVFVVKVEDMAREQPEAAAAKPQAAEPAMAAAETVPAAEAESGRVISLDSFRKK